MKFLIIFITIFVSMTLLYPINKDTTTDTKIKVKPYLIIEQKTNIITDIDLSSDTLIFDSTNNESSVNAGLNIPLHKRFILKPFIKNVTLWNIDESGIPDLQLNELSFAIGGVVPITKDLKFGIVLANTEIFTPKQVIWSGFKTNVSLNYSINKFLYFNIANTTRPLFKLDNDNKFKTFLTNRLESELSILVFKKINSGIYFYDDFIFSTVAVGKAFPKRNFTNELEAGFQFKPVEMLTIYTLGSYDFLYQSDNQTKTNDTFHEIGVDLKLGLTYKFVTFVAGYNPKFYRNINSNITIPIHNFELNVFINL